MSRHPGRRLDDVVSAAAAIEDHLRRGPIQDPLVFDAVRARLIEIGEAVRPPTAIRDASSYDRAMGPTRVLLVADTHLPKRAKDLPAELWSAIEAADVVVHAGDWVDETTLDAFEARSRRLVACVGNNDGPGLRARLPEVARVEIGGLRFAVVHETGPSTGRDERCAAAYPDVDVLVFGHSHIPWHSTAPGGLVLLNPGSPTDRRRQPRCTYLTLTVQDGAVTALDLHRLPLRLPAGKRSQAPPSSRADR